MRSAEKSYRRSGFSSLSDRPGEKRKIADRPSRYELAAESFSRRVSSMRGGMTIAFAVTAALWLAIFYGSPKLAGMAEPVARIAFALKCVCVTVLLCFLTGVEAVSHERLQSDAFDPVAGRESTRLKINARYLQNTLEQLALFIPGLLALAFYCSDEQTMRAVTATTIVGL